MGHGLGAAGASRGGARAAQGPAVRHLHGRDARARAVQEWAPLLQEVHPPVHPRQPKVPDLPVRRSHAATIATARSRPGLAAIPPTSTHTLQLQIIRICITHGGAVGAR